MNQKTSWFAHGTPPYPGDTKVRVWFRDGGVGQGTLGMWRWEHRGGGGDIVAYEVLGDAPHVFNTALDAIAEKKGFTFPDLVVGATKDAHFDGVLPADAAARKNIPVYSGFVAYFPDAICAVAELSRIGNDQHNPGKPLHWDRSKSGDEQDAEMRHMIDGVKTEKDTDGVLHKTKKAWRAMADLQKALEARK